MQRPLVVTEDPAAFLRQCSSFRLARKRPTLTGMEEEEEGWEQMGQGILK